jgi:aldose sugar dehydrogenase
MFNYKGSINMMRYLKPISLFSLILFVVISCNSNENNWQSKQFRTQYHEIRVVRLIDGLEHPWSVAFLPDGRKLVTERPGRLNIIEGNQKTRVSGLPEIHAQNQGGLMEVVLHPNYGENGWIYMTYSKSNGQGETATALIRARLDGTRLTDVEEIFVQDRYSSPGRHYGSKLAWMSDGTLLMSIGDRGTDPPRAQDLKDHAGTLIRIHDDGSVPTDNPFVNNDEALDEIYSYGHRNIQGLVVNPDTDEIWLTEHGPRGGDLLHLIEPGNNYGWPIVTQGLDYRTQEEFPHARARRMEGVTRHVYEFLPTHPPGGLAMVTSDRFPRWEGDLLAGGLASERIRRLVVREYEGEYEVFHDEEMLLREVGRIRDVREGPDGYIYVVTDLSNGALYRIEPAH